MIIECPSCQTTYELPVSLPAEGRKVRCESCRHVWLATAHDDRMAEEREPQDTTLEEPGVTAVAREDQRPDDDWTMAEAREEPDPFGAFTGADFGSSHDADAGFASADSPRGRAEAAFDDFDAISAPDTDVLTDVLAAEPRSTIRPVSPRDAVPVADDELMFFDAEPPADAVSATEQMVPQPPPAASARTGAIPPPRPAEIPPSKPITPVLQSERTAARVPKLVMIMGGLSLGVAVVLGLMVALRDSVVEYAPAAADMYRSMGLAVSPRGLEFDQLSYRWQSDNGQNVLEVRGDVINITRSPLAVPTVVFALRDDKGAVLFHWAADVRKDPLQAGERAGFVTRIPSPPEAVRSVQLHFAKK